MKRSGHLDTFARDNLPPKEQWPEFLLDNPDVAYSARLNCAAELVDKMIDAGHGERSAIHSMCDGQPVVTTYRQLRALVGRIAHVLCDDLQLVPGNRVLLRGPNNLMMAACWLAIIKAGLVAVPTMPLLRAKELKQIVDKARITAALCDVRLKDDLEFCRDSENEHHCATLKQVLYFNDGSPGSLDARMAAKPDTFEPCDTAVDDVCLIAFTSGTTGQPKGTMHFHRDVLAMCDLFPRHILKPGPDDIFCGTPPLAFTFGTGGLLTFPLRVGASTVLIEKLTPEGLLKTIQDFKASIVFTAPTFYRQMAVLAGQYDIRSLKKSVSAGEALPDATRQLWKQATGIEMIDGIGGTEMIHIFVSSAGKDVVPGAVGKPVPGYIAQIVDDDMNPLPPGQIGKLAVKGPTGCRYLADERQKNYVKQGWNLPGDTFICDEAGNYYYQARSDDMIISAGYNIAGPEVEAALLLHPAVAECGVVGVPDEARGQIIKAFVVLKPGQPRDETMVKTLQEFVKATIAPYKYPRAIVFVDALPRTETGKLQRFKLR